MRETARQPLSRGLYALVDEADFNWLNQWKWSVSGDGRYAVRRVSDGTGKRRTIYMHRLLAGTDGGPSSVYVDHINHNTLDNRRGNLRTCTSSQNLGNSNPRRGSSKYKGVSFMRGGGPRKKRWVAIITKDGKGRNLGYFHTEEEAAGRYDEAAAELFGEFARLNFPNRLSDPYELRNAYSPNNPNVVRMQEQLRELKACAADTCREAENGM